MTSINPEDKWLEKPKPPEVNGLDVQSAQDQRKSKRQKIQDSKKNDDTIPTSSKTNLMDMQPQSHSMESIHSSISTSNSFDELGASTSEREILLQTRSKSKLASKATHQPKLRLQKQSETKEMKAKPIFVARVTVEIIQNFLQGINIDCDHKKAKNQFGVVIFANNLDEKKKILERLREKSFQFHTYGEPSERLDIFLLKGHHRIELEVLLREMIEAGIPATRVAFHFDNLKSKSENKEHIDPVYKVFFEKGKVTFSTLSVRHKKIDRLRITWDRINSTKKTTIQCHRCQLWGHGEANCNRIRKCVKCTEAHEKGACARISKEGKPSCTNCKGEHLSSWYGCPVYIRHMRSISRRQTRAPARFTSRTDAWGQPPPPPLMTPENFPLLRPVSGASCARTAPAPSPAFTSNNKCINNINTHVSTHSSEIFDQPSRPSHSRNKPSNGTEEKLDLGDLCSQFNAIDGIQDALRAFANLIKELNANTNPQARAMIMARYAGLV